MDAQKEIKQPTQPIKPAATFKRWHLDYIGRLTKTQSGNEYILLAVDSATSYIYLKATSSPNEQTILSLLQVIVQDNGLPDEIVTDNARCFTAPRLTAFCNRNKIQQHFATEYHPQANGKAERHVKLVKQILARLCSPDHQSRWDEYLFDVTIACRNRKHSRLNQSPYYLASGLNPRLPASSGDPFPMPDVVERPETLTKRVQHFADLQNTRHTVRHTTELGRMH